MHATLPCSSTHPPPRPALHIRPYPTVRLTTCGCSSCLTYKSTRRSRLSLRGPTVREEKKTPSRGSSRDFRQCLCAGRAAARTKSRFDGVAPFFQEQHVSVHPSPEGCTSAQTLAHRTLSPANASCQPISLKAEKCLKIAMLLRAPSRRTSPIRTMKTTCLAYSTYLYAEP